LKNLLSPLRSVIVLAFALGLAVPLLVADDWQPITQEDLKMTSADAGNAEAIILYHEFSSDDGRRHQIEYERIKILTEKGKRYANVEIRYGQSGRFGTQIVEIKARTISPDGRVTPFSGEVFDKTVVKGHGLTERVKSFTFPDAQIGSIIEWRYTEIWTDDAVVAARWILQEDLPQKHIKFSYTPFRLDGSTEILIGHGNAADGVFHVEIGLPKGASIKTIGPLTQQLEMTNIPAYEGEEFSPPAEMMKMRVYFYYGNNNMSKAQEFWKEQGAYWNKEVEKFVGHSSAVAQAAQEAVTGSDTPDQKLRKLYALVQKLDNRSYQGRTFIEELADDRKATKTAEQVLKEKTGYHDELARLFVALVRSLNLQAYLMRVATREETFFQQALPEWGQLNSEVAIVVLPDAKELFLDPGAPLCPFGLLEWKRTATAGLRQRADGNTELSQTPGPAYADAITQRIAQLKLERDGSLNGRVVLLWIGQEGLRHRIDGALTDEAGRKKAAEEELKALLLQSAVVKLDSLEAWDDPDHPLKAVFHVELPGYAAATGKRLLVPGEIFRSQPVFLRAERKTPVFFDYPYRVLENVQITLPAEMQVENLPQSQPARTDLAFCSVQRTTKDNVIELRRDFVLGALTVPLADYPKLKSFFEKVRANDDEQVTLQLTPAAAAK
jgi:hypothetical protein